MSDDRDADEPDTRAVHLCVGDQIEMQKADNRAELTRLRLAVQVVNNHLPMFGGRIDPIASREVTLGLPRCVRLPLAKMLVAACEFAERSFREGIAEYDARLDDSDGPVEDGADDHGEG